MSATGQVVAAGAAASTPRVYATWNPSDKAASISLAGGNLIASASSAVQALVRSTIGKSSGKWYWEVTFSSDVQTTGIDNGTNSLTSYLGNGANGWGYQFNGAVLNNAAVAATYATYANGDVMGIALDMDGGTLKFYKNNSLQGTAATGLSGTYYAGASGGSATWNATANFGATTMTYSPPAGYNAGLYN